MKNVTKVFTFLFTNRRVIGTMIGGMLILLGHKDEGEYITHLGEQL